jgi:hypothetical protein
VSAAAGAPVVVSASSSGSDPAISVSLQTGGGGGGGGHSPQSSGQLEQLSPTEHTLSPQLGPDHAGGCGKGCGSCSGGVTMHPVAATAIRVNAAARVFIPPT